MTTNKGLRVFAVAALGLGLFSANTFAALPVDDPAFTHTQFQIRGRVEDSISVTGLSDVEVDFDNMKSDGRWVISDQRFTVERNGATADAPGFFSITAKSQYGAAGTTPHLSTLHATKNQRGDMLPVEISHYDASGPDSGEKLLHGKPLSNRQTTGRSDEHILGVAFPKGDLENANPGFYNTNVTLYITAE